MPVDLQSYAVIADKPLSPNKLLVDLRNIVNLLNKVEARGAATDTQLAAVQQLLQNPVISAGGGSGPPTPIGPFPPVVIATAGALSGDGSITSPLAVRVDGSTIQINGSNQLEVIGGGGGGITQLTGAVTAGPGIGSQVATIAPTGIAAGTYGDATHVARVTVNVAGQLTAVSLVAITDLIGITQLTGDVTAGPGSGSQVATLANTAVTPATYGDATHVGQFTVDAKGRITSASNVLITDTGITQLTGDATAGPGSGSQVLTLANSGVSANTYGSATTVPVFTVDVKGRVTAVTNTGITGLLSGLTSGRVPFASSATALSDDTAFQWDNTAKTLKLTTGNLLVGATAPTTGTLAIILGDGTVPATMASNTAGLYANDVSGTVQLFGINEAGSVAQLTDCAILTSTATGTANDFDITAAAGGAQATYVRLGNASDLTITGIVAGFNGQEVTFVHTGAGNVFFKHQDTGSASSNRLINVVTIGDTPLGPSVGSATYRYDTTSSKWRLVAHVQGAWINATFSAGEFTANGSMTWTVASGDVSTDRYYVNGATLTWQFRYITTTVGGTVNSQLLKTIPAGYQLSLGSDAIIAVNDNGGGQATGLCLNNTNTQVAFQKLPAANWTLSTDLTQVRGTVVLGIA